MYIYRIFLIIPLVLVLSKSSLGQNMDRSNRYMRSFTFGINNSAFMSRVNGQPNDYNFAPSFRQGVHVGYAFLSKKIGLFEAEYGVELNHLVLKSPRQFFSLNNFNYFRLHDENNILSLDFHVKVFISPAQYTKYRFFGGYRLGVPFKEFFLGERWYMRDNIFTGFLQYWGNSNGLGRFTDYNYVNHFITFGTDYKINERWVLEANFNAMLGIWLTERRGLPPVDYRVERYMTNFQILAKYRFKSRK
jgi:hypothetical protein